MSVDLDVTLTAVRDAFGEHITIVRAAGGAPATVAGVWQDPSKRHFIGENGLPAWIVTEPSVGLRLVDLPAAPKKNDRYIRLKTGVAYLVVEPHLDGVGWANVILKVAA